MTHIRAATEDDRLGLFKLAVDMHAESDFSGFTLDPLKALDGLGAWIHSDKAVMLVAVDGADVVGMLAGQFIEPWFTQELMASEDLFFVRKDKRGGSLAYRLFKEFVAFSKARGATQIRAGISTGKAGYGAGRLYEKFGLQCVGGSYSLFTNKSTRSTP